MIKLTDKDKTLTIPSGLGNFGQGSGSGGGITPEEAAEIASAVTAEALDEYDTELQVDLEEIREAVSANTGTLLDLSQIAVMTVADRVALFDEIYDKAASGEKVYIKGLVQEETIRTAILPLVSYRPETDPVLHQGGYLYFAAKGDTDNIYFHVALSSEGAIDPTSSTFIKRNIYSLPTASSEVKGGVKVGSGLLMTQDTLSLDTTGIVTDGDLAPFIVQLSGNTEDISELSSVTSALTQTVAGKQDALTAGNGIDLSGSTISVKIGDGLGFSGDTLVVSGGSGEQNYVIVDDLSEISNPVEGMLAYRREYTEQIVYTGYTMGASSIEEGYVAQIYYNGTDPVAVYRSGDGFYWDWDNDASGELRKRNDFYYTINSEHTVFTVLLNNPDAYVTFEEGVVTATTSTTLSVLHMAVTYLYNGTSWIEYQPPKVYYLNNMTQAERAALYREIYQYTELTFPAGNYRFFVTNEGNDEYQGLFEVFVARFYGSTNVSFSGSMQSRYSGTILQRGYDLTSEGDFYNSYSENMNTESLANDFQIRIDSNGYIASDMLGKFGSLAKFNRIVFAYQDENIQNNYCAAPLKYFYRKNETINGEDKLVEYIGVEININGTWYKGDWHFIEYEWSEWIAPDTWTTI